MGITRGTGSPSHTENRDRHEPGCDSVGVARSDLGRPSQSHRSIAVGASLDQPGLDGSGISSTTNLASSCSLSPNPSHTHLSLLYSNKSESRYGEGDSVLVLAAETRRGRVPHSALSPTHFVACTTPSAVSSALCECRRYPG
jgi:hypothetical protein